MGEPLISIRVNRMPTMRGLQAAAHASRLDRTSAAQLRPGADSSLNYHHRPWCGAARPDAPTIDYVADFEFMLRKRGVPVRSNAAPIAHCIVQVSLSWIKKGGDLHDPENPRNRRFFDFALRFAEHAFGPDAVFVGRMDHDETGGGTVDVLVSPRAHTKTGKPFLSVSPALREIQERYPNARNTFSALQDCIAEYAQTNLDPAIKRGKLKEGRSPDRLTPENFAARKVNERRRRRLEVVRVGAKTQRMEIKADLRELEGRGAELDRQAAEVERRESAADARTKTLDARESQQLGRDSELDAREASVRVEYEAARTGAQEVRGREIAVAEAERQMLEREKSLGEASKALADHEQALGAGQLALDAAKAAKAATAGRKAEADKILEAVRNLEKQTNEAAAGLVEREQRVAAAEAANADDRHALKALREARIAEAAALAERNAEVRVLEQKVERERLALGSRVVALQEKETKLIHELAAFEVEKKGALDRAKADGVAAAAEEIGREFRRARAKGLALGREQGREDAGALRAIPLETVAELLGGEIDKDDALILPNLGRVLMPNKNKPHRYRIEQTGKTGGGALDLVRDETGWDYPRALRFLRTEHAPEAIAADKANMIADTAFAQYMNTMNAMPEVVRDDCAPASPEHREVVTAALEESGLDADLVQSAIKAEALEATVQGSRLFARWTLRNHESDAVGYRLEPIDGGRAFVRGSNGWCMFDADPYYDFLEPNSMTPQYWLAATPRDALAAISVARKLAIQAIAPLGSAKIVACEHPSEELLTEIADRA